MQSEKCHGASNVMLSEERVREANPFAVEASLP